MCVLFVVSYCGLWPGGDALVLIRICVLVVVQIYVVSFDSHVDIYASINVCCLWFVMLLNVSDRVLAEPPADMFVVCDFAFCCFGWRVC